MPQLPFTGEQFFSIFALYNGRFLVIVAAWWIACLVSLIAAWRNPQAASRVLTTLVAALWMWNAIAYHAVLFTRINPGAWLFALMFAVQAWLLAWADTRCQLIYFSASGAMLRIGVGLVVYALLYPFFSVLSHAYPATPTFAVPCPTTLLTLGLFLTVRTGVPISITIVPVLWALIGGSAAVLLAVSSDFVLLAAGLLFIGLCAGARIRAVLGVS